MHAVSVSVLLQEMLSFITLLVDRVLKYGNFIRWKLMYWCGQLVIGKHCELPDVSCLEMVSMSSRLHVWKFHSHRKDGDLI